MRLTLNFHTQSQGSCAVPFVTDVILVCGDIRLLISLLVPILLKQDQMMIPSRCSSGDERCLDILALVSMVLASSP